MGLSLLLRIEEQVSHYEDTSAPTRVSEWTPVQRIDLEYRRTSEIRKFLTYLDATVSTGCTDVAHVKDPDGSEIGELIFSDMDTGIRSLSNLPNFRFFEAIAPMLRYYERMNNAYNPNADFIETQYRMIVEYH